MLCFLGESHAAQHLRAAAVKKKLWVINSPDKATVIFISEDTPTDDNGNRQLGKIRDLVMQAHNSNPTAQLVLTSQVPPGFTRSLGLPKILHQAETLRIKDAEYRADNPEYIAVGGDAQFSNDYAHYLASFGCAVLRMSWEEAEMSKIAVNMALAAQVDYANRLSAACAKVGADWEKVCWALAKDSRIGPHSYLTPGRWQDSKHLMRDAKTLKDMGF